MPAKIAVVIATTTAAITNLDNLMASAGVLGAASQQLTDANRQRVLDWMNAKFDPGGTLTDGQAAVQMAQEILAVLKQTILNREREQARVTADAGVPDMPMT